MITTWIQPLVEADQSVLLFLNSFHTTFWDYFMYVYTGKLIWIPMYATILYVLLRNYDWKVSLMCVVAIALTITFADQVCGSLIRPIVARPRPANELSPIAELIHIVNNRRGGSFGFPSCHASNSFGLAFFLLFLFRKRSLSWFILIWAAVNSYTRIYLGLHYPGDLIVGALVGGCGAWLMHFLLGLATKQNFRHAKQTEVIIYTGLITVVGILIYAAIKSI